MMVGRLQYWLGLCLLLCGLPLSAQTLLWVTADITPPARSALVEKQARAQGWQFRHLDHPLGDTPARTASQQAAMNQALQSADMVWVDAPHASVEAKLDKLFAPAFATFQRQGGKQLLWIRPQDAAANLDSSSAIAPRLAAYLAAGGEVNTRHAITLASRWYQQGKPATLAANDLPPPKIWPQRGLYHPAATDFFADATTLAAWQQQQAALRDKPAVAVLVHRHHFIHGETAWLDRWLALFAKQGLFAYAVFGQQLDPTDLGKLLTQGTNRIHPRAIVLHQLSTQSTALQNQFDRWGVPVLSTLPYRHGDIATWEADGTGLKLADTPFYLVQPEAAGAIDPLVVTAHPDGGKQTRLIERQASAVSAKARRLIALRDKPAADKQLVAMVYNYPPGGSNFGASFLNVPRSLETVSQTLAANGYDTRQLPEADWISQLPPLLRAYYDGSDLSALLASNQAAALPLRVYRQWWQAQAPAVRERIKRRWGEPESSRYVVNWRGEPVFVIPRLQIGKLSVLPQPPREETLYRGQNPFMHRSRQPVSHHYLAVYLWAQQADALIHFGTHGTQEWAPGKSRGLDVQDDALLPLGDVPVIYPYIVDNLGEALTAKRRGRALLISHRTPVFATTGLAPTMAHLHELMHEWAIADNGPTKVAIGEQLIGLITSNRLHHDLKWTEEQLRARLDDFLEALHPWLDQLAHSSQPQGLAVFGRAPDAALRSQIILQALRTPLLDALGEDVDEAFLINQQAIGDSRPARWLKVALQDAVAASQLDLRPPQPENAVPNRAAVHQIDREALLDLAKQAQALDALLAKENELPALLAALEGRFIPAAYGGDPIRNPDSLPTGRNLTGLDPSRLPTRQAYTVAELMFKNWLDEWQKQHQGQYPKRLALSLWAGETLRHQGIMEAQALVALGVRPVWDKAGRPSGIELIPSAQLGRPRVDVLLSVTGSYRDQFPALMALVDKAVEAVSLAEPQGVVASHSRDIASELVSKGIRPTLAATLGQARVFGNALGDYGTGIDAAVQDNRLQKQDERLGGLFLQRMSQPYLGGEALVGISSADAIATLGAQLRRTDAAVLSRTSHLYGMVSSDDPFQYLGGLAAAARSAGRDTPLPMYVNQLQNADEPFTQTAQQSVAMEMQSRYLHPGWIAALKKEGYAGTLQVLKAAQYSWGWQSVSNDVIRPDHWQGLYDVLVKDSHQLDIPAWLKTHPQAYAQTLERLIQAQRHGHWTPDADTRQQLASLYQSLTAAAPLSNELAVVRDWVKQSLPADAVHSDQQPAASSQATRSVKVATTGHAILPAPASLVATPSPQLQPVTADGYVQVQGQRLLRQPEPAKGLSPWLLLGLMLSLIMAGAFSQWWQSRQPVPRTI